MARIKQTTSGAAKRADLYKAAGKTVRSEAEAADMPEIKKKRHVRPGAKTLGKMRRLQKSVELIIPKAAMKRLARDSARDLKDDIRFSVKAMFATHEATESAVRDLLAHANELAMHAGRKTVQKRDVYAAAVHMAFKFRPGSVIKAYGS